MREVGIAERPAVKRAFQDLVQVCMDHREVWCAQAISNQAMARLFTAVELLAGVEHERERVVPPPRDIKAEAHYRLCNHLIGIFEQVELCAIKDPDLPNVEALLATRAQMPDEGHALVTYAQHVLELVKNAPGAFRTEGMHKQRVEWLDRALQAYSLQWDAPPKPVLQYASTMSMYQRLLNTCIRHLLELVDPVMTRYPKRSEFATHYRKARKKIQKLDIGTRMTYHVDGVGQVSERHTHAKEWPTNLGAQDLPMPA